MLRPFCVAGLALSLVGCASSDKSTSQLSNHWSNAKFGAPAEAGLSPDATQAAASARILADVPAKTMNFDAVVMTAKAPLYESPSTTSRLMGNIRQGGTVKVEEALLWYRLPDQWHGSTWGELDGLLPTWAKVNANGNTGFTPWRCLGDSLKDPAKVERGALAVDGDTLESSRKNFSEKKTKDEKRRLARATKGMAGGEIAQADPDFESLNEFMLVSNVDLTKLTESPEGLEIDFKSPTPAEEFFVGRISAARILGAQSAFGTTHPLTAYVRGVGNRVAANSTVPRPYGDWIWIVVEEPEERNAFALSGGFVFITTGMLDFLANEDELAAVLAHEVAHVEQGHPMDAIFRANNADEADKTSDDTWGFLKQGASFASAAGVDSADDVQQGMEVAEAVDTALGIRAAIFDGIMQGYDQPAETEADGRGITLTAAAGYDPRSMAAVITSMVEAGVALTESHYSPKRRPQVITLTEVFLQSDPQVPRPDLTPQPDTAAAAKYRATVESAMKEVPSAPADPGA